jgi:hypothetical protein
MSDPVTNIEIEDVLSSIRRLVSNGPQGRGAKPADRPAETQSEDRLVLTPALRVDDSAASVQHDSFVWKDMLEDAKSGAQDSGAEPEPEADIMPEPDSAYPPADGVPEAGGLFQSRRAPLARDSQTAEDHADAAASHSDDDAPGARDAAPLGLEAQAAEFEAAVASRDDQWEPDGTTDDALAGQPVPSLDWRDLGEETPTAEPDWAIPDWASAETRAAADPQREGEESTAQDHDKAPDAAAEAEATDAPQGLSIDDSLLDEESLRDLIAEIVREELQGALGERITRNVRKLVRREIHRALTSQDFD